MSFILYSYGSKKPESMDSLSRSFSHKMAIASADIVMIINRTSHNIKVEIEEDEILTPEGDDRVKYTVILRDEDK